LGGLAWFAWFGSVVGLGLGWDSGDAGWDCARGISPPREYNLQPGPPLYSRAELERKKKGAPAARNAGAVSCFVVRGVWSW
jgi:hypothetical protein